MEIPTIEEFFKKYSYNTSLSEGNCDYLIDKDDFKKAMFEFTKLHVEKAIKSIYNVGLNDVTEWSGNPYTGEGSYYLCLERLEKQYPLENIE